MKRRKCLLFSDSYSINDIILKKCILAFDDVNIIDCNRHTSLIPMGAIEDTYRFSDGNTMTLKQADYGALIKEKGEKDNFNKFLNENSWALKKNALFNIDPNPVLEKNARMLRMTYDIDLSNPEMMKIISEDIDEKIFNGNRLVNVETSGGVLAGLNIAPTGATSPWALLPKPTDEPFNSIEDKELSESIRLLSWTRISKLLTALILSVDLDAIPVTNIRAFNDALIYKYEWLKQLEEQDMFDSIGISDFKSRHIQGLLQYAIVTDIFSDDELSHISIRKLIAYRKASRDELARFYSKLVRITDLISKEEWNEKLEIEIQKSIEKEIAPDISDYIETKKALKDKIIGSFINGSLESLETVVKAMIPIAAVKSVMTAALSTGFIMPNVTLSELALFSGLFAAKLLKESVKTTYDAFISSKSQKRKNAITYFMKLKK